MGTQMKDGANIDNKDRSQTNDGQAHLNGKPAQPA
jgi:hypothetical protein